VAWVVSEFSKRLVVAVTGVATALTMAVPQQAVAATTTCDRFGTVSVSSGSYIVQENEWNSSRPQCMSVSGTSWTLTTANFHKRTSGPPATYPSIFRGCHRSLCTTSSGLPIRVSDLSSARSSWSTKQVSTGAYNTAYDLWTNTTPSTAGQADGSEIMIWLTSRGSVQPAGSKVATARVAGATWEVWTTRMSAWNYIAYRRVNGASSVTDLDLRAFIQDSVTRRSTDPSWYLIAAEAGFEIWKGGKGLGETTFSFAVS
jgi:hypothetical protein